VPASSAPIKQGNFDKFHGVPRRRFLGTKYNGGLGFQIRQARASGLRTGDAVQALKAVRSSAVFDRAGHAAFTDGTSSCCAISGNNLDFKVELSRDQSTRWWMPTYFAASRRASFNRPRAKPRRLLSPSFGASSASYSTSGNAASPAIQLFRPAQNLKRDQGRARRPPGALPAGGRALNREVGSLLDGTVFRVVESSAF